MSIIEGDHIQLVVQVGMHRAGDDEQFLVLRVGIALHHGGVGVPAEVAGVGLLAVDDKDGGADLIAVPQNGLIHKRHGAGHIPAAVGVQGPGVVAPGSLVVVVVVLHIEGGVLGHFFRHTAAQSVGAALVVLDPLGVEGLFLLIPGGLAVLRVEVAVGVHPGPRE